MTIVAEIIIRRIPRYVIVESIATERLFAFSPNSLRRIANTKRRVKKLSLTIDLSQPSGIWWCFLFSRVESGRCGMERVAREPY